MHSLHIVFIEQGKTQKTTEECVKKHRIAKKESGRQQVVSIVHVKCKTNNLMNVLVYPRGV